MFRAVLVYGVQRQANVISQWWEARRWTGSNQPGGEWEWLTPTDFPVTNVTVWAPLPELK